MHNRREYLSGKANGLGLPSREKGDFPGTGTLPLFLKCLLSDS